jgi:hypothetical protein
MKPVRTLSNKIWCPLMLDSSQELGGSINWKEKRGLLDLQVSK